MDTRLLHVLSAQIATIKDADAALTAMRRSCPRGSRRSVLLFCDLAPGEHAVMMDDEPLIRRLQSGVMAANARSEATFYLLVRTRSWSDAARLYLGQDQMTPAWRVIADLITDGRTKAAFRAATCAPDSLKGRYDAILFSQTGQLFTPDTPAQMLDILEHSDAACLCAQVYLPDVYPEPLLVRLLRGGFSLDPRQTDDPAQPVIVRADTLDRLADLLPAAPLCACRFVLRDQPTLPALFAALRMRILRGEAQRPLLAAGQILLLFASALAGAPLLALLVLLLPEIRPHPSRPSAALARVALLPLTACLSLDAWLCVRFAHARRFRLRVPDALLRPSGCAGLGALLLLAALRGAGALPVLLIPGVLWLAAPLTERALPTPVSQRIPINTEERSQFLRLAKDAYAALPAMKPAGEDLPLGMLAVCGAMLLDLLEPDEAARQIQSLLSLLTDSPLSRAAQQAALLTCAQCLRERMSQCDAALRDLPAQIEQLVLAKDTPQDTYTLSAWLACSHSQSSAGFEHACASDEPIDLLFLPLGPVRAVPRHALSLPVTHPHTFLRRHAEGTVPADGTQIETFLFLCGAALDHPFYALLARSPIAGPYAALLMM